MLKLALNGGVLSSIWDAIKSIVTFFSNFTDILKGIFQATIIYAYSIFYYLFMGICSMVNFAEMLFKKFAGIDPIMTSDGQMNILDVFVKSNEIWGLFVSILILSIVLLFIFTIVAVIKSEFSLDAKGSAKGPIIARSLKSLAMFVIVPVVSLLGVYAVNAITDTINSMMKGSDDTSMVNQIFYTMSYNANKARINEDFADFINGYSSREEGQYANDNGGAFKGSQEDVAYAIDMAFKGNLECKYKYKWISFPLDMIECQDFSTLFMPVIGSRSHYSIWDITQVNLYYSVMDMDYIIGLGSAIAITFMLLSMCITLIKRIFEIVILLLLAAPMISLAPLDGGSASKKWQGEFIKRVIAIVAPVFAINMYFIMIPLFMKISIFGGALNTSLGAINMSALGGGALALVSPTYATYDAIFQLLAICVGMSVVKTSSALLCNLLGIQDMLKEGTDQSKAAIKKAVSTAGAVAATVATGGAAAGALVGQLGAGKQKKAAQSKLASTEKDVFAARAELNNAEKSGDQSAIDAAKKKVSETESARDNAKKDLQDATNKKEHADSLAKEKRESLEERIAPNFFKAKKEVKDIKKNAGKTKADIAADDELKKMEAQEAAREAFEKKKTKKASEAQQEELRYRAQGQVEHSYDSKIKTATDKRDDLKKDYEKKQKVSDDIQKRISAEGGTSDSYADEAMAAAAKAKAALAEAEQALATLEQNKANALSAVQRMSGGYTKKKDEYGVEHEEKFSAFEEDATGGIKATGGIPSKKSLVKARFEGNISPLGQGEAHIANVIADNINNKNLQTGKQNVDTALAEQQKINQENVEMEAARERKAAVDELDNEIDGAKKELDAQAMGEGVQQGLSEAMGQLQDMITNAMQSAKLNVNDIKNLAAEVKAIKTDIKRSKDGDEGAKTVQEILKAINDLANKLKK